MVGPLHSKLVLGCPGKKNLKPSGNTLIFVVVVVFCVFFFVFFFFAVGPVCMPSNPSPPKAAPSEELDSHASTATC